MSIVSKISATAASLVVGITGVLVLTIGATSASAETDWNKAPTGSTNSVAECDWNKPVPC
jgi:hypothetical protein